MISLNEKQARVYEAIKSGCINVTQVAQKIGMEKKKVSDYITDLRCLGFINIIGGKGKYTYYEVIDREYQVKKIKPSKVHQGVAPEADPLLNKMVNVELPPEKIAWIKEHRKTIGRSKMAKELGISKLELTYLLTKI